MSDTARVLRDPCGCRSTDSRWVSLCNQHDAEWRETHERWGREHRARNPLLSTTSPETGTTSGAPAAPDLFS